MQKNLEKVVLQSGRNGLMNRVYDSNVLIVFLGMDEMTR